jgi:hypothetical protein
MGSRKNRWRRSLPCSPRTLPPCRLPHRHPLRRSCLRPAFHAGHGVDYREWRKVAHRFLRTRQKPLYSCFRRRAVCSLDERKWRGGTRTDDAPPRTGVAARSAISGASWWATQAARETLIQSPRAVRSADFTSPWPLERARIGHFNGTAFHRRNLHWTVELPRCGLRRRLDVRFCGCAVRYALDNFRMRRHPPRTANWIFRRGGLLTRLTIGTSIWHVA